MRRLVAVQVAPHKGCGPSVEALTDHEWTASRVSKKASGSQSGLGYRKLAIEYLKKPAAVNGYSSPVMTSM